MSIMKKGNKYIKVRYVDLGTGTVTFGYGTLPTDTTGADISSTGPVLFERFQIRSHLQNWLVKTYEMRSFRQQVLLLVLQRLFENCKNVL